MTTYYEACPPTPIEQNACLQGMIPNLSVTLPQFGLPQISLQIPNFSGLSIDGLFEVFGLVGLDPCAFLQSINPLTGIVAEGFAETVEASTTNVTTVNGDALAKLFTPIQGDLEALFANTDVSNFSDPCGGLVNAVNEALAP